MMKIFLLLVPTLWKVRRAMAVFSGLLPNEAHDTYKSEFYQNQHWLVIT